MSEGIHHRPLRFKEFAIRRLWLPRRTRSRWSTAIYEEDFKKRLAAARESGGREAVSDLLHERAADEYFDYEQSEIDFTKALILRARELRVPIPEYPNPREENEWWSFSFSLGERYLSPDGITALRDAIRREERWQHERRGHWIAWFTAITGVLGALIGLVSLLR